MSSREDLKTLLDKVPESSLESVESVIRHLIMQGVAGARLQRLEGREMGSGGWSGEHNHQRFGGQSFRQFDNGTLVERTLQFFDGHEIELTERLSLSPDGRKLLCSLTVSSGGKTLSHEDEFPASKNEGSQ